MNLCARDRLAMALLTVVTCMGLSEPAHAVLTGLQLELHTTVLTPSGTKNVYRVYARFTEPGDRLVGWGGTPSFGAAQISTRACYSTIGGNFFNAGGGSRAPSQVVIDALPHAEWDTFATIGVSVAEQGSGPKDNPDSTGFSFQFPPFIPGNQWQSASVGSGVVLTPFPPFVTQGRADYANDGDLQLRVLMMQLTVAADEGVSVVLGYVAWIPDGSEATLFADDPSLTNVEQLGFPGRCCFPDGTCSYLRDDICSIQGGQMLGCVSCMACGCPSDITGDDGDVNIDDLLAVINTWGACPGCAGDITPFGGNGQVNIDDLLLVINSWGPCP